MRLPGIALAVVALLLTACGSGGAAAADCERIPGVREGVCLVPIGQREAAPAAAMPTVGGDGRALSVSDLAGRVVVMNFWASWCGPCRLEQPDLNEAFASLPSDEVAFVGVNIEDTEANALAHEREFGIPYPSLYDPANDYASRFEGIGPRTIPSTVFLDRDGRVAARVFGVVGLSEVLGLADALASEA